MHDNSSKGYQQRFFSREDLDGVPEDVFMEELRKANEKTLQPPNQVERSFTFTYSELQRLLWLFGTDVALEGLRRGRQKMPTTSHTDAWVIPRVNKQIQSL